MVLPQGGEENLEFVHLELVLGSQGLGEETVKGLVDPMILEEQLMDPEIMMLKYRKETNVKNSFFFLKEN